MEVAFERLEMWMPPTQLFCFYVRFFDEFYDWDRFDVAGGLHRMKLESKSWPSITTENACGVCAFKGRWDRFDRMGKIQLVIPMLLSGESQSQ